MGDLLSAPPNRRKQPFLEILHEKCIGCGACVAVCEPISLQLEGLDLKFEAETCISCVECFRVCPTAAVVPTRGRYYKDLE